MVLVVVLAATASPVSTYLALVAVLNALSLTVLLSTLLVLDPTVQETLVLLVTVVISCRMVVVPNVVLVLQGLPFRRPVPELLPRITRYAAPLPHAKMAMQDKEIPACLFSACFTDAITPFWVSRVLKFRAHNTNVDALVLMNLLP